MLKVELHCNSVQAAFSEKGAFGEYSFVDTSQKWSLQTKWDKSLVQENKLFNLDYLWVASIKKQDYRPVTQKSFFQSPFSIFDKTICGSTVLQQQ